MILDSVIGVNKAIIWHVMVGLSMMGRISEFRRSLIAISNLRRHSSNDLVEIVVEIGRLGFKWNKIIPSRELVTNLVLLEVWFY